VDFSVIVTPPEGTKVLRVWLPIPPSDSAQQYTRKELFSFPLKVEPVLGTEKKFGNTFAYFEFRQPRGGQMIRHRFTIKTWDLHWRVDPEKVQTIRDWPASFHPYLRSDRSVVVDDRFRKLLDEIVPRRQGGAKDLAEVIGWVQRTMKYDHVDASLRASSEHALTKKTGHCSDYHGLCAAFGRALGYPTRVAYGINLFPKNSPSHCKLEVFLPPYGWVSFDVSETQKLIEAINKDGRLEASKKSALIRAALDRLFAGFRDNTWFLQTRGTDYELEPRASRPVPVVRTIWAEADGEPLPEPDPANPKKREHAWMTIHEYRSDRPVNYPFKDWESLK
jgi:transglutaminase-like putative cysteine protease